MGSITFFGVREPAALGTRCFNIFFCLGSEGLSSAEETDPTATCTLSINVVFPVSSTAVGFS